MTEAFQHNLIINGQAVKLLDQSLYSNVKAHVLSTILTRTNTKDLRNIWEKAEYLAI